VRETTTVVIVGGGPAGLTAASLLACCSIPCVVLEARDRSHVFQRQRAGIVEHRAVRMFERWGLAERALGSMPRSAQIEIRLDGTPHVLGRDEFAQGLAGSICPQQVLVANLISMLETGGGDLRFGAADVELRELSGSRPVVSYRDPAGELHEIECDFVAGCDGDHGISRHSVPDGALNVHVRDYGVSWLTILAAAPPPRRPFFAISSDGFAAHFPRGPEASRFYLECPTGDRLEDWPPHRIWDRLCVRLGDRSLATGPITDLELLAHRSVVHDPMSYGRLYLLGDAAHIVPPLGGKGMNLALHDAEVFAQAVRDFVRDGDESGLKAYSRVCLERVWSCQELAQWMLETMHNAGDATRAGDFQRAVARARLHRLFTSPVAEHALIEVMAGSS
jgi:p-hydroxybenzoate 3-monooxygenase